VHQEIKRRPHIRPKIEQACQVYFVLAHDDRQQGKTGTEFDRQKQGAARLSARAATWALGATAFSHFAA